MCYTNKFSYIIKLPFEIMFNISLNVLLSVCVCLQDKVANVWCSLNVLIKIKTLMSTGTQLSLR